MRTAQSDVNSSSILEYASTISGILRNSFRKCWIFIWKSRSHIEDTFLSEECMIPRPRASGPAGSCPSGRLRFCCCDVSGSPPFPLRAHLALRLELAAARAAPGAAAAGGARDQAGGEQAAVEGQHLPAHEALQAAAAFTQFLSAATEGAAADTQLRLLTAG
ncbi:hypothetical protein QTO34_017719 [Cnephaeus nilssonii]|uniref:Uncharacterized protein n=1 Tax=Cnephaeus nilssonii TaxID=3371016 RepID=A0AA40I2F2_CNENI|nr:hypothetical protein QTO34_017719 [Eptesicus nilssonii]